MLTYFPFPVSIERFFAWSEDLLSIQASDLARTTFYADINWNPTTHQWDPFPGITQTAFFDPAWLATLTYDLQPDPTFSAIAQTLPPYTMLLRFYIGRAPNIAQYTLYPANVPPQPESESGWTRRTINLDFRRRRPARNIQP